MASSCPRDVPLPSMTPWGPLMGGPQRCQVRFALARLWHQFQVQRGGSRHPSVPTQAVTAARDFQQQHTVSHGKSPGIPDPSHAGGLSWAPCPEALGMGSSASSHQRERAPGTLPEQLLLVCTGSAQATS